MTKTLQSTLSVTGKAGLIALACASILAGNVAPSYAAAPNVNTNLRVGNGSQYEYQEATSANPGDTLNFRVFLQNTGDATGTHPRIVDTLDSHLSYIANSSFEYTKQDNNDVRIAVPDNFIKVEGSKRTWGFQDMPANPQSSLYLTFQAKVNGADQFNVGQNPISNTATSSFENGAIQQTNTVSVNVNKAAAIAPAFTARLEVTDQTKGDARWYGHGQTGAVSKGDTIEYRLIAINNGSADAQNVTLKDLLPAGQTFNGNVKLYQDGQNGVQINNDSIVNGGYAIASLLHGNDHAATVTFEAKVTGDCTNDLSISKGQILYGGNVVAQDSSSVIFSCSNGLIITKQVLDPSDNTFKNHLDNVAAGTTLTYRIEVLNNGAQTVPNPTVRDVLSGLETYVRSTLTIDGEHEINATQDYFFGQQGMILTNLTPGLGKQIEFQATLAGCQPVLTNVKNTALVHGDNAAEITATADVTLVACVAPVVTPNPVATPSPVKPVVPVTTLPVTGPEMALIIPGALSGLGVMAARRIAAKKALTAAIRKINVL